MKFTTLSDKNRCIKIKMDHINLYTERWKPGTSFEVEIVKRQPRVSDPARKFYFSAILPGLAEGLGYDIDEKDLLHRQLKIVFFGIEPDEHGIYRKVPSVFSNEPDATPTERGKFLDWVMRKAAQYGVYIEDPRQQ